jgi:hypothetical protein
MELLTWLSRAGFAELADTLRAIKPERGLAELVATLDPESPPSFAGVPIPAGLPDLIRAGVGERWNGPSARLIEGLAKAGALTVYGRNPRYAPLAIVDEHWQRSISGFNEIVAGLPAAARSGPPNELRLTGIGLLLLRALDPGHAEPLDQVVRAQPGRRG